MVSKRCTYAIQAVLFLVKQPSGRYTPVHRIGEVLGISPHFLAKILQVLTEKGILISHRGPAGGVALNTSPEKLAVRHVIEAIDGPAIFESCVLGLPSCSGASECLLSTPWPSMHCIRELGRHPVSIQMLAAGQAEVFSQASK